MMDAMLLSLQATILANASQIEAMKTANLCNAINGLSPKYKEEDFNACTAELTHVASALRSY